MDDLVRDPRRLGLTARQAAHRTGASHICLVVDQFEELFTLCRSEVERKAFVDNLLAAANELGEPTIVVIALRADFYAHCADFPGLRQALASQQEYIGALSAEEIRRAIEEPAQRGGWELEPGLVELLLQDVGAGENRQPEPGALPLLSHALLETWERRRGRALTVSGYLASGGVRGAIAETAEAVFHDQLDAGQQAIARNIFLRLTEPGETEAVADTRRRVSFDELVLKPDDAPAIHAVLTTLADARLITTEQNSVEVAHEALIREWPTLRGWLEENCEGLRLHRHLTEAAQEWERQKRDPGELYRGARLAQAREWAEAHSEDLNTLEKEFLDASNEWARREEAEREAQRQRELDAARKLAEAERRRAEDQSRAATQLRRRALYLAGAFVLALAMAVAALFFGEQARQSAVTAQNEQRIAFSRELAAAAISNLTVDPERSILLALEAVSVSQSAGLPVPLEAEDALHQAVQASRVQLVLRGYTSGQVVGATFNPAEGGTRLATFGEDEATKVWDATTGKELLTLQGHYAAFSPDGTRLATVVADGTVKMWDAVTGDELTLASHVEAGIGVTFSPDGTHLATAPGNVAKIWDATTGRELVTFSGHTDLIGFAFFSPDGTRLLTASDDGTARVWNATTGEELLILSGHNSWVLTAAFSPDGKRIATVSAGSDPKVWDASTGQELLTLVGHTNIVFAVAFSPDGTRLATGSLDRKVKVWDAATGQELFTLSGHAGAIFGLDFSPDGTRLVTSSDDGTVRLWDLTPSHEWLTLSTPNGSSGRVAFSSDGTRLAMGLGDGTAKVWNASSGQQTLTLTGHTAGVNRVAFDSSGTRLATASDDQTAKIWDAHSGAELFTLREGGHSARVNTVAFSPDGMRLATAGGDYTAKMWDATTGQLLFTLGHSAEILSVAFSPDGTFLLTGISDGTAKVWDALAGKELLTLSGHTDTVWGVAYNPDGTRIATASRDDMAKVWDAMTGEEMLTLAGHTSTVVTIVFSPDGTRLATASRDGTAKLWDVATGRELLTLLGDGAGLNGVAFSPDGTRLATGGDTGVHVYLLRIEDLVALARTRVTRSLTSEECQKYLHLPQTECAPVAPAPTATALLPAAKGRVCQVTLEGGLNDNSYNELIYQGSQDAARLFEWESVARESSNLAQAAQQFLGADCDLIVSWSVGLADPARAMAEANPDQKFQIVDLPFVYDPPLDNVWAQAYATDQAAFLAGYVAASVTKTGKVGTFGGIALPTVTDFMDGFALGVAYYNAKNGAKIELLGWNIDKQDGLFAGGFVNVDDGRRMAEQLMDEGADIILPVAGRTGLGAAATVQEHGDAYIIGVDNDWTAAYPEYADIVLTSIEKRFAVSVILAVKAINEDTFTGGTHLGTLETGEVGLSPFHNLDSLVSSQVKADLEQITADIIAAKIKTKP